MDASPPPQKPSTAIPKNLAYGCLGCFGLIIVIAVAGALLQRGEPLTPTIVSIGKDGELHLLGEGGAVPVFASAGALDAFIRASVANDPYGRQEALNQAWIARGGTWVRVIGTAGLGKRHVRIMEGPHIGRAGYVVMEWVRPR